MVAATPGIDAVRTFWNKNPLFAGELSQCPGEKAFFEEHRRITLHDHGGFLDPIFVGPIRPTSRILDVGCGIGFWVHEFCLRTAHVSACDLSDTAVSLTQERLKVFDLIADVRQGNAEQLPYEPESFDHINCQGVIHHTPNTAACISEFHRMLRPGGTVSFSVYYKVLPLRWRWLYRLMSACTKGWLRMRGRGREQMMSASTPEDLVRYYDGAENPIGKAYTRAEVESMLTGLFAIKSQRRLGFPRRVLPFEMPDWLYRFISKRFGLIIVFLCQKL
jgi:SAM-dependent methyltransferase